MVDGAEFSLKSRPWKNADFCTTQGPYSLPNSTFGSGENSNWQNFALAKYLAEAFFVPKYFITTIFSILGQSQ